MRSMLGVVDGAACAAFCGAGALMAYGVRGRSATLFAPSVYRGPASRRSMALTFDDGPSESTPALLEILSNHGVSATFFQCGANVRRLPEIASEVARCGHEVGNHSDTHPRFYFRRTEFITNELTRAQSTIAETTGVAPALYRAPFGIRWPGMRIAQARLRSAWGDVDRDGPRLEARRREDCATNCAACTEWSHHLPARRARTGGPAGSRTHDRGGAPAHSHAAV